MRVPIGCSVNIDLQESNYIWVGLRSERLQKTFYLPVNWSGFFLNWRLKRALKKLLKQERKIYEFKEKYC